MLNYYPARWWMSGHKAKIPQKLYLRSIFFPPNELGAEVNLDRYGLFTHVSFCFTDGEVNCVLFPAAVSLFFLWANLSIFCAGEGPPPLLSVAFHSCFPSSLRLFLRPSLGCETTWSIRAARELSGPP